MPLRYPLLALLALAASTAVHAQSMTGFANHLAGLPPAEREAAVDSFWAQLPAVPWIDGDTAHFLYRDPAALDVRLAGDFNGWNPDEEMGQLSGTSLWRRSRVFEPKARMDYKIVVDGSWILDPANPNTVAGGFGPNSELAMPAYVQPWEIEDLGAPAGAVSTESFASGIMGKTYQVTVYLPPGYDPGRAEGYPVAYFQDGHEYVGLGSADLVFDNLLEADSIEAVIGIFVRPTNRNDEYAFADRDDFADFFATELVPWVDATWHTAPFPERRAVIGPSFGGNISARIVMAHPWTFANLGVHSGAFWPDDYATDQAWDLFTPLPALRVANIYGSYEGSLTGTMRSWTGDLAETGVAHIAAELPEGHSWGLWRATLDDMLQFFFPPEGRTVGIGTAASGEGAGRLWPVPATGPLHWQASGPCREGTLRLLTLDGREILRTEGRSGEGCTLTAMPPAGAGLLRWEPVDGPAQTRRWTKP